MMHKQNFMRKTDHEKKNMYLIANFSRSDSVKPKPIKCCTLFTYFCLSFEVLCAHKKTIIYECNFRLIIFPIY